MIKRMVKTLENNPIKVILITISIVILFAITVLSKSKYVSGVNSTINLNIRKPEYTIYFYPGTKLEGNAETQVFSYGTAQNLRTNTFTKPGYSFAGWNTEEDGSGTDYTDEQNVNNLTSTDGDTIDLFAQWEFSGYTITYVFGDEYFDGTKCINTGIPLFSTANVNKDFEISCTVSNWELIASNYKSRNYFFCNQYESHSPWPGFSFYYNSGIKLDVNVFNSGAVDGRRSWGKTSGSLSIRRTSDKLYLDNVQVADFTGFTQYFDYPLTIGANIDFSSTNPVPRGYSKENLSNIRISLSYEANEFTNLYSKLPAPTKTGTSTFDGWYTAEIGGTKVTSQTVINPGNITLYARWNGLSYSVAFDANGGTGTMATQTGLITGTNTALSLNSFTKAGYVFAGWNTRADGTGESYSDGQLVDLPVTGYNPVVTLYAQWDKVSLLVQPDGENAAFLGGSITKNQIESITFANSISGANGTQWDVSSVQDNSILAWYTDTDSDGLYEVTIGSTQEKVVANRDSSRLLKYIGSNPNCDDTTCLYGIENLDVSNVRNMGGMFANFGSTAMTSLDLGNSFDTSNVTEMWYMFNSCGYNAMTSINLGPNFNTENVTTMAFMFADCGNKALTSLNLGNNFDTSNVNTMEEMFSSCGQKAMTSINLGSKFDTSRVTSMLKMFYQCGEESLTALNLGSYFNTSNVNTMNRMFMKCGKYKLTSLDLGSNYYTSNVRNMEYMFYECGQEELTTLTLGSHFDTSNVTNMEYMFDNCGNKKLTSLDLGSYFNTANVEKMQYMFYKCGQEKMTSLNLGSSFNTSKVTNMKAMFCYCGQKELTSINLGNYFDTSLVKNMESMFDYFGTYKLTSLDLGSNFNTSNVLTMRRMFELCGRDKMTTLNLGNQFDTSNVTNMESMFAYCGRYQLTSLDLGLLFDTSNVTTMELMFRDCGTRELIYFNLGPNFDTSSVTNMAHMFFWFGTNKLTSFSLGDKFDTSNVTNMENMFASSLKSLPVLDLTKLTFDTNVLANYTTIFYQCGGAENVTGDNKDPSDDVPFCTVYFNQDYTSFVTTNKSDYWLTLVPVDLTPVGSGS